MPRVSRALAAITDPREQRFIEAFVQTNHQTQSAIVAGVPPKGAAVWASRSLKKPKIRDAIAVRNAELMVDLDFQPHRILRGFARIAAIEDTEVKTPDVLNALKELAKIAQLYPADRTELSGPGGGPIQSVGLTVHKVELDNLTVDQREQMRQTLLMLKAKRDER